ncbi:MAG TPA: hypothetical protein VF763_06535 [Candidatus Limnocylindrales bacterium]
MSDQTIKLIAAGVLLLHGLGHGGALGALAWIRLRPGTPTGAWHAAQSWLVPSLPADTATAIASALWVTSLAGFVIAAMSFWGVLVPDGVWRPLAVGSAVVSIAGIGLFFGTWPMFNTLAALAVNVVVLVAVLWLHWSPAAPLGA